MRILHLSRCDGGGVANLPANHLCRRISNPSVEFRFFFELGDFLQQLIFFALSLIQFGLEVGAGRCQFFHLCRHRSHRRLHLIRNQLAQVVYRGLRYGVVLGRDRGGRLGGLPAGFVVGVAVGIGSTVARVKAIQLVLSDRVEHRIDTDSGRAGKSARLRVFLHGEIPNSAKYSFALYSPDFDSFN